MNLLFVSAFTVFQALCSTVIALFVGSAAAFFTVNRTFLGKKFLLSLSSVPLCIPSLLVALGFVSFFGVSGTLNTILKSIFGLQEANSTFLYSFFGIIIAQGFYNFPLVMANIHDTWSAIPTEQADAARLLGANETRVFRTVTIFQILPAIVSSCMLVFLYCFFSFLIILLFGGVACTTLEVEIYKSARATLDFGTTTRLAITETVLACLFVALYTILEKKSSKNRGIAFYRLQTEEKINGVGERLFALLTFALILIFFIAPLFSIFYNGFSSAHEFFTFSTFAKLFKMRSFLPSLTRTLIVAICTSFLCVFVAFFYAVFLRSFDPIGKILILKIFPMIPMCISSVVTGVGIILLVKKGSPIHLILSQVFLTWPLAFRQIYAALSKIPDETIDAARILSRKKRDLVFRIYLPESVRGILSAAGFCFAVSAGDTTLPLVLAIQKFDTLALFTYRLAGNYRFHEACASGLILGSLCAIIFASTNRIKNKSMVKILG